MTAEATITKVRRTGERLSTQVGYTKRERHITILAAVALRVFGEAGWTIDFLPDSDSSKSRGLRSIWEYIAWQYPIDEDRNQILSPTDRDRWESVNEFADDFRKGFSDLRKHLAGDWRDVALYIVPRSSASSRIEVITVDGLYQVNDAETAMEIYEQRNRRIVIGQVRGACEKLALLGKDPRPVMEEILQEAIAVELPEPRLALDYSST